MIWSTSDLFQPVRNFYEPQSDLMGHMQHQRSSITVQSGAQVGIIGPKKWLFLAKFIFIGPRSDLILFHANFIVLYNDLLCDLISE